MFAIEAAMGMDLLSDMDDMVLDEETEIDDLILDVLEKAEEENEDGRFF